MRVLLAAGFVIALAVAGCRGDNDDSDPTTTPSADDAATASLAPSQPSSTPTGTIEASATAPTGAFSRTPGTHERAIQVDGRTRKYVVHIPPGVDNAGPLPAVIVLHGGGGNGNQVMRSTRFDEVADEHGFIAVFPHGNGRLSDELLLTWNAGNCCGYARSADIDDVGFIRVVVDEVIRDYGVDPGRVFATGMSNGGMMSYRLACDASGIFLGIAPVAGALNLDCAPDHLVSVLAIHGTDDRHVLYDGGEPLERADLAPRVDTSVADSMGFFVETNGCAAEPATSSPDTDGLVIVTEEWLECAEGSRLVLYTVEGGVHEWPGDPRATVARDFDASRAIWEFFAALQPR